jgi:hypothetical protein
MTEHICENSISPLFELQEAAQILRVSPRWLRDHADEFGGTREFGKLKFFKQVIYDRLEAAEREVVLRVQKSGHPLRKIRLSDQAGSRGRRGRTQGPAPEVTDKYDILGSRE